MIIGLFEQVKQQKAAQRKAAAYKALLHYEARLGGELFGPVPAGTRREFFCLDRRTWVWHEEWTDQSGKRRVVTTRYDVRPSGIVKSQGANSYQALSPNEEQHFRQAVSLYGQRVRGELHRLIAQTS